MWRQVHVGVAMDLGRGLIVPKVRNADRKSIREISADLDRLVEAAKAGSLALDDLTMGTFTLTNLGAWDIDDFTPIVNHPESAILGVGRIVSKAGGPRRPGGGRARVCAVAVSFDHRIIDGAPGAAFLKTIKDLIEEPQLDALMAAQMKRQISALRSSLAVAAAYWEYEPQLRKPRTP